MKNLLLGVIFLDLLAYGMEIPQSIHDQLGDHATKITALEQKNVELEAKLAKYERTLVMHENRLKILDMWVEETDRHPYCGVPNYARLNTDSFPPESLYGEVTDGMMPGSLLLNVRHIAPCDGWILFSVASMFTVTFLKINEYPFVFAPDSEENSSLMFFIKKGWVFLIEKIRGKNIRGSVNFYPCLELS